MSKQASTEWQLDRRAAERYQTVLVPFILGPAAVALVEAAQPAPGERVLDVGCGTGAACRAAAVVIGSNGRVVGVDVNAGMLEVGRALASDTKHAIEWKEANALKLPFDDRAFDLVLSAQTLQFLPDRERSLTEILRVLRPAGRVAASLWCSVEENPYFHALTSAMTEHIGPDVARGLEAAFGLSDQDEISRLVTEAGFSHVNTQVVTMHLELPAVTEFVPAHIGATPMSLGFGAATPDRRAAVIQSMNEAMVEFTSKAGIRVPFSTFVTTGLRAR